MQLGAQSGRVVGLVGVVATASLVVAAAAGCSSPTTESASVDPSAAAGSTTVAPPISAEVTAPKPNVSTSPATTTKSPSASASSSANQPRRPPSAVSSGGSKAEKPKPTKTPAADSPSVSAPGKSAPRLTLSATTGFSDGTRVTVKGTGFDTTKGIYIAFCVKPSPGEPPGPCGGGADTDGDSAASEWISSNPPPYGKQLATPYGTGGSFSVTIRVSKAIGAVDCAVRQCVIASRADHTRASDRSQDVLIPIKFG